MYIDGEAVTKKLPPVEVDDLFPDKLEKDKQDKLKLASSDMIDEMDSTFQAYAYKTGQMHEVRRVYKKVRRTHPGASHVVAAYNIKGNRGYQDDAEHGAGSKLLKLLEQSYPQNTMNVW